MQVDSFSAIMGQMGSKDFQPKPDDPPIVKTIKNHFNWELVKTAVAELANENKKPLVSLDTLAELANLLSDDDKRTLIKRIEVVDYPPRGTLLDSDCVGKDKMGKYADGFGGSYRRPIQFSSPSCGG